MTMPRRSSMEASTRTGTTRGSTITTGATQTLTRALSSKAVLSLRTSFFSKPGKMQRRDSLISKTSPYATSVGPNDDESKLSIMVNKYGNVFSTLISISIVVAMIVMTTGGGNNDEEIDVTFGWNSRFPSSVLPSAPLTLNAPPSIQPSLPPSTTENSKNGTGNGNNRNDFVANDDKISDAKTLETGNKVNRISTTTMKRFHPKRILQ
mmetsp:Transcript_35639/g.41252  ORF Transcript_35639/g.41252 Transcript_35639/m.41252 type:complete len:208 (-) Transcript_35639:37-660(-)